MIPLAAPSVNDEGIEHVSELLTEGTLSVGTVVSEFESEFCQLASRQYGVAVASGSVALELALEATFDSGERIALSPYNCGAMLYSVLRTDLEPVFVDAESTTGAISSTALESADVDGVLLSHLFGTPAHVEDIINRASATGATVVEDFAQAPGAIVGDRPVGSFGRVSVCSFGATKNLTTAEGGIVVTDDDRIATYVRDHRSNTDDVAPPPRSVRMNDIEAAIGLSQLAGYEDTVARKQTIADVYREELSSVETTPVRPNSTQVYQAFPIFHERADALAAHLDAYDIGTSRLYDTLLTEYDVAPSVDSTFPVARRFSDEAVLLPIHAGLSDADVRTVAATVEEFCSNQ